VQSTIMPGGLHGLIAIPPVTYEAAEAAEAPQASASMVFVGWRNERARFRVRVDDEMLEQTYRCEPRPDGSCEIHQIVLRIEELPRGRARIELISASSPRSFTVCFNTDAPGDPCPED
jgi:hypothetical protein